MLPRFREWGKWLKPKVEILQLIRRHAEPTVAIQEYSKRGFGGEASRCWVGFLNFWQKIAILKPFERDKFPKFGSHLKKLSPLVPPLQINSKTRLKAFILGLNFFSDWAQKRELMPPLAPLFCHCPKYCSFKFCFVLPDTQLKQSCLLHSTIIFTILLREVLA